MTMTRPLPVGALHADDDTECTHNGACDRLLYWAGGTPSTLAE